MNDQGYLLPFWQRLLLRSTYVLLCTAVACIIVSRGGAGLGGVGQGLQTRAADFASQDWQPALMQVHHLPA